MKNLRDLLSNQSGVSLIEVTAAAAISVIISLGIMKTNETGQKGMTKVTTDLDIKLWQVNNLMRYLGDPETCRLNFPGNVNNIQTRTDIIDKDGNAVFTSGQLLDGTSGSWQLAEASDPGVDNIVALSSFSEDSVGSLNGRCTLSIYVRRTKKAFGNDIKKLNIPAICSKRTDDTLASCTITSDGSDTMWMQQVATGTEAGYIFNNGNVVVGDKNQIIKSKFEVTGNSGLDFPSAGTGVKTSMRITNLGDAFVFADNEALYADSDGCFNISSASDGTKLDSGLKHCATGTSNTVSISSTMANFSANSLNSVILGGSDASVSGSYSLAAGQNVNALAANSHAIGSGVEVAHSKSMVVGSSTGLSVYRSTTTNQFTALFDNGFRFITGPTASDILEIDSGGSLRTEKSIVANGGVKLGDVATACSASIEGTTRYNSTDKQLEFCDGTSWKSPGGGEQIYSEFTRLIAFQLNYDGTNWSVGGTKVMMTKDESDLGQSVVVAAQGRVSGAHFRLRVSFRSYFMDSSEIVSAVYVNKAGTPIKMLVADQDGNNTIEIKASDDASWNDFQSGDSINFIQGTPRM